MEKELYLTWVKNEEDGSGGGYYNQYFSLIDAVSSEDENTEIFKANLKSLGQFKLVVTKKATPVKSKKGKK